MHINNKTKQDIYYIIAGPDTEGERAMSAETTQKKHDEFSDLFTEILLLQIHFLHIDQR